MIKETRQIKSYKNIDFKDFGTLILTQGERESLTIEADQELLSKLISEVHGDTLVLGIEDDWLNRIGKVISSVFNNQEQRVVYHLTCVNLEQIKISGKCTLECDSLVMDKLLLKVSGFGNIRIDTLDCDALDISISGRGDITLAGRTDHHTLRISGSADFNAPELSTKSTNITISGQGSATLRVQEELNITISGFGQVNYYGNPKIRQVISGFGKSKRLNDS